MLIKVVHIITIDSCLRDIRGILRTRSHISDGGLLQKSLISKSRSYFCKKNFIMDYLTDSLIRLCSANLQKIPMKASVL